MADTPKTTAPETTDAAAPAAAPVRKKKGKKSVPKARVCIHCSENNTIVTFTDQQGNTLAWASAGSSGFEGTRKSTPYAGKVAAETAAAKVAGFGVESVSVELKGVGPGREQSIRGLQGAGLNIDAIVDRTPIAHGGCRRSRRRRV